MRQRDVLSLPILDVIGGQNKFHGFVSIENILLVFFENAAGFLRERREEPFSCSNEGNSNPSEAPAFVQLGLKPGDVSRFGCPYDDNLSSGRGEDTDPVTKTFTATVKSLLERLTHSARAKIVAKDSSTLFSILQNISLIPRAHRCLIENCAGRSHAQHSVLSCTNIIRYLNALPAVQEALSHVMLSDVPQLYRKGFTVLKSGETVERDETLFVPNNETLHSYSTLDFFPSLLDKVSVAWVTTTPNSFVSPRVFNNVHVRGDLNSADLRGMSIENLSLLKNGPLSFACSMRRKQQSIDDNHHAFIKQPFESVDPNTTSLKDCMVLLANGCRRVYIVCADLSKSGVLDARNLLVGLAIQDEDIETIISESSE